MEKKYRYTEKELGDVFEGKVIYTDIDLHDLVAYILREEKDTVTGRRRYKHVAHTYTDMNDGKICSDVCNPPFKILKDDMDTFHPPGKYLIKVVNRYNKARCYGSVLFYNEGENYLTVELMVTGDKEITHDTIDESAIALELKKLRTEVKLLKEMVKKKSP